MLLGVVDAAAKMLGVLLDARAQVDPELPTVFTVRPDRGFLACTTTLLYETHMRDSTQTQCEGFFWFNYSFSGHGTALRLSHKEINEQSVNISQNASSKERQAQKLPDSAKVKGFETNLTSNNKYARLLAKWVDWARRTPTWVFHNPCWQKAAVVVSESPQRKVNILRSCYPHLTSTSPMNRTNKPYKSKAVACGYVSLFCCLSSVVPRHNVKLGTRYIKRYFPGV